jgi:UDP-N-acetylglucosamine--N-acetylmuramyl-(pentapeptide) pyrophosphoryl-undecaprenol N-acetylglucosamine transferase
MRLLIAGGGTGGHLYPGMAVAQEVTSRPGGEVLFVGTSRGLEARVVPAAGYALELIEVSGLKRMSSGAFLRGLSRLPAALARSLSILRRFQPDVVLGVGGYASGPLVLAAALARRRTAIQEQNSVPGVTNRILGRLVDLVFVGFEEAAVRFPGRKVVRVGNPVRRSFLTAVAAGEGASPGPNTEGAGRVLVVGGSQGARALNDLVVSAVELLARGGQSPVFVHQTGLNDAERVASAYQRLGVAERVSVRPFIEDMAAAYLGADVVVGRAGALTLAELAVVGRPALLVPLPTAADDHQTRNARAYLEAGAAVVLHQTTTTAQTLADELSALLGDPARRAKMALAMRRLARPQAARDLADRLEALARTRRGHDS